MGVPETDNYHPKPISLKAGGDGRVLLSKPPSAWRKGILPFLQSFVYTPIHNILSTLVIACGRTLRGPVLGDHRGNQLSKLRQRTAGSAAWQREGVWLMLGLIPVVHLYKVLPGGGREKTEPLVLCR